MKRLTERRKNGAINVRYATEHETAIHRLAAIEDILGDEYELDLLRKLVEAEKEDRYIIMKEPRRAGVHRLTELAEADRDGRCVVLPWKLHDKIFYIDNGVIRETEAESFHNWISGRWKVSAHTDRMYDRWKGYEIDFSDIGEIAFLTRAEAEEALKAKEAET